MHDPWSTFQVLPHAGRLCTRVEVWVFLAPRRRGAELPQLKEAQMILQWTHTMPIDRLFWMTRRATHTQPTQIHSDNTRHRPTPRGRESWNLELDFEFEFELDFEFEFELIFSQFFTIIVFDYCLYRYTIIFYIIDPTWVYISAVLIFNRMREAKQTWQDAPMLTRSKPRTIPFQNESSKWPNSDPNWFNDYDIIIFPPLSWTSVLLSNDSSCDKSIDCSVRSLCSASPCYLRKI